jgi:hypothetical protein
VPSLVLHLAVHRNVAATGSGEANHLRGHFDHLPVALAAKAGAG